MNESSDRAILEEICRLSTSELGTVIINSTINLQYKYQHHHRTNIILYKSQIQHKFISETQESHCFNETG